MKLLFRVCLKWPEIIKSLSLLQFFIFSLFHITFLNLSALNAATLSVETDYKLSGISYSNLDFDTKTSSDAIAYYTQRLRLAIGGKFPQGIEIYSRLQSLSVVGSTDAFSPFIQWKDALPYPFTNGTPFVENLYLKISDIFQQPADVIIGRQEIDFAEGLLSDNSAGLFALRSLIKYPKNFSADILTAKVLENFSPQKDFDIYGVNFSYSLNKDVFGFVFLTENDYTGRELSSGKTSKIIKNFYGGSIKRTDEFGQYRAALIKQSGDILKEDGTSISLDGIAWDLSGILKARDTKIGDVSAGLLLSMFSGDDSSTHNKDENFAPTLPKRFDGLKTVGYGKIFGAAMNTSALSFPAESGYSGINTIGLLFEFSPIFRWSFGVNYFLYSASENRIKLPESVSGFEKILGAKYSLGIEMNLYLKFIHSKYVDVYFGYFRYTRPREIFWTKVEPLSKYQLDIRARF